MLRLRITSDLHTEFWGEDDVESQIDWIVPPLDTDSATTLVIAGDLGSLKNPAPAKAALDILCLRFFKVVWVMGNHDYYGGNLDTTVIDWHRMVGHHDNLVLDNFEKLPFDFLGGKDPNRSLWLATMWTDFNRGSAVDRMMFSQGMNDAIYINGLNGRTCVSPKEIMEVHGFMRDALLKNAKPRDVIVSHHLPSLSLVHPRYKNSPLNHSFAADLDSVIEILKPSYWICGHTHTPIDTQMGDTKILCNPVGYVGENPEYDPFKVIEIPDG